MARAPFPDRTRVCFQVQGDPQQAVMCGTLMVAPNKSWGVLPDDPPFFMDASAVYNVRRDTRKRVRDTVGWDVWGGIKTLANPFSSPLSPIAQTRKVVSAFTGSRGAPPPARPAAPPAYAPDYSQQLPGYDTRAATMATPMRGTPPPPPPGYPPPMPPAYSPQGYPTQAPPMYAPPAYAPPTGLPGYDLSAQYAAPAAQYDWSAFGAPQDGGGWDAAYGPSS